MIEIDRASDATAGDLQVLLVEDNPGDAHLIQTMLSSATSIRLHLEWADRLATGLEHMDEHRIDLVLLDLSLPDSHGIDTFRATLTHSPGLPVIVLTGVKDDRLALQALHEGAQDYLVKGETDSDGLLRAVRYGFERNRIERELRRSEARYRTFFEQSKDAIYIVDGEGRFVDANRSLLDMFGYSLEELRALESKVLYLDAEEQAQMEREIERRGAVMEFPVRLRTRDGTLLHCLETCTAQRGAAGELTGYQGIIRNVTERLELEQKLLQAQKMEAVGQLAGGVAHDFNNILTGISGYASLMLRQLGDNEGARADTHRILEIADRATHLTSQLLAFSRRQTLQKRVCNLNDVVRDANKMTKRLIRENIELRFVPARDLANVRADPGQMDQVLLNLVINARDAMPEGGRLLIETANARIEEGSDLDAPAGEYAVLRVRDTGVGMDAETQRQIFEPFFTTKGIGHGTGLGLATVYGIVKQHGGALNVISAEGEGATFEAYLPCVAEQVDEVVAPAAAAREMGGSETLLLVEDDEIVRSVSTRVLEMFGYRVLVAERPSMALQILEQHSGEIALMISDVVMPEMNGPALYEKICERHAGLRVLYVSGYAEKEVLVDKVLRTGAPFLAKPFTPTQLARMVRGILDHA